MINNQFSEKQKKEMLLFTSMGNILWIIQEVEFLLVSLCHLEYDYLLSHKDKENLPRTLKNKFEHLTFEQIISDTETCKIVLGNTEKFLQTTSNMFDESLMFDFRNKRNKFIHEYFLNFQHDKSDEKYDKEMKNLVNFMNEITDYKSIFQGYLDFIKKIVDIKQGKSIDINDFSEAEKN
ncbi:MAG TPA: hypothetical protein ENK91_11740, partial [Bacteroidetes bacterium]|nr:hypothetical protein [Bacteroidota bacterium]